MIKFAWAVNLAKLDRAKLIAKDQDEEAIKEAYISLGGKVLDEGYTVKRSPETTAVKIIRKENIDQNTDDTTTNESPLVVAKKQRLKSIP